MNWTCIVLAAVLVAAVPVAAPAASQGKVVIAQGVDPTTLDPMNHQETPATPSSRCSRLSRERCPSSWPPRRGSSSSGPG
jgi:hypothetical protein